MERLNVIEGRVVASLVEKQLLTPQAYPLTLHALTAACNQSTSRDPVMILSEGDVEGALESLKALHLVRFVLPSHGRSVVRYRHVLDEVLGIDAPQLAVLAVLELRGPQTAAELRARTERMARVESVEHDLALLVGATPPLVRRLERRPGQKEERWQSLLTEKPGTASAPLVTRDAEEGRHVAEAPVPSAPAQAPGPPESGSPGRAPVADPALGALKATVAELRREVDVLRAELAELRESLGG